VREKATMKIIVSLITDLVFKEVKASVWVRACKNLSEENVHARNPRHDLEA
jgi:hypothetical protein